VLLWCRQVIRPQPLFDFDTGGMPHPKFGKWINLPPNPGFWRCMSVRQGDYKWSGIDNKIYR
jgi:hypothetical protein